MITGFYVCLVLTLIGSCLQWTVSVLDPDIFAVMYGIQDTHDSKEEKWRTVVFIVGGYVALVFENGLNWFVVMTIYDLSNSIQLLAGRLS